MSANTLHEVESSVGRHVVVSGHGEYLGLELLLAGGNYSSFLLNHHLLAGNTGLRTKKIICNMVNLANQSMKSIVCQILKKSGPMRLNSPYFCIS